MKPVKRGISAYQKSSQQKESPGKGGPQSVRGGGEGMGGKKRESQSGKRGPGPGGPVSSAGETGKKSIPKKNFSGKLPAGFFKSSKGGKGFQKAAKFLMLLGKEDASNILQHLTGKEIEGISQEIANTEKIDIEEANQILAEFGLMKEKGAPIQGGAETAREMLVSAFGVERGEKLFKKVVPHGGEKPFNFLNDYEFQQILILLKKEPPHVLGVVLPYLEPEKASKVLESLPRDVQRDVVKHVATMKKVDSDVLSRMEEVIKTKIRTQGRVVTEEIDGKNALAGILKHLNPLLEQQILENLEASDPQLSEEVRDRLFTMDTIIHIPDRDLQEVLRDYAEEEIAFLLKGKSAEIQDKFLMNVSERRRIIIQEEISILGEVKRSEVDKATKEFLRYIQTLVEEGKIRLIRKGEDEYI